jgi:hypothetical protein
LSAESPRAHNVPQLSMNGSMQNLEEAANVASEFIYSKFPFSSFCCVCNFIAITSVGIDNLPHEVAHILKEIKHKEIRSQGLSSKCHVTSQISLT